MNDPQYNTWTSLKSAFKESNKMQRIILPPYPSIECFNPIPISDNRVKFPDVEHIERGLEIHSNCHRYFNNQPEVWTQPKLNRHTYFYGFKQYIVPKITHFYKSEFDFVDKIHRFKGRCDALVSFEGKVSLTDWKTTLKPIKSVAKEISVLDLFQLVAYYCSLQHDESLYIEAIKIEQLRLCYLLYDGSVCLKTFNLSSLEYCISRWKTFLNSYC